MSLVVQTAAVIKEEEIRPDELFGEFLLLAASDAENFFDHSNFVEIDCPACGSAETRDNFTKFSFKYGACTKCGTLYASSRPTAEALLDYYARSQSQDYWANVILKHTGEKREQSILRPNLERIEEFLKERERSPRIALDVGASNGAFLLALKENRPDLDLVAVEPGHMAAEKCRSSGIKVYEDFVENCAGSEGACGDLVTCFEVFEHVQDPLKFAKALCDVTLPGGMAVITCLGADGFDIQLLWEKSRSIMPPYHLNFLSKQGMEALFGEAGFDRVEVLSPGRLDVQIVQNSIERDMAPEQISRFEKLLLSKDQDILTAFQKFLSSAGLSSHVWILAYKD